MKLPFIQSSTENNTDQTEDSTEQNKATSGSQRNGIPNIGRFHKDIISPSGIYEEVSQAKVGNHHVKTFFINGWPDAPNTLFLDKILKSVPVENDISIHVSPYQSGELMRSLGKEVEQARARLNTREGGVLTNRRKQKEYEQTAEIYQALEQTNTELFDVGMYITIRGESKEELNEATDVLLKAMRSAPALLQPAPLVHRQLEGMQAVSPIGADTVGYKTEMMGGAIGTMLPYSSKRIIEDTGVDFGVHAGNNSPVIVDRWTRENGYNQLTIGKIGSGKSFSIKLNMLRSYASRDDVLLFILDPVGGFDNIVTALKGERVTVGGKLGLNPMEIRPTPERVMKRASDIDPYAMKKATVIEFFEMYFSQRGVSLDDSRGVLETAVEAAYFENGITRDISTHDNPSPTIKNVIRIVELMAEEPSEFVDADSDRLRDRIETQAARLITGFTQFKEGGQFENLAGESELDIRDNNVTYFDLTQKEGSGEIGLMMTLLFSEVYQIAKETDKKVMFIIDEAHYLMKDAETLDFLTTAVRHSRHLDLSINFITQTIEEFFSHHKAQSIAQLCSLKLFQRTESDIPPDIADTLDLNQSEINFIQTAQAGSQELGYSEALLGVGSMGYVPIRVIASDLEENIINYEDQFEADEAEFIGDSVNSEETEDENTENAESSRE
ncbi:VirB4 family type IV secretion system protein [Haloquadratum walsbyi]|uniref:TraG P-loop domain-containing protein n=1 Tax=Haloquadratum walsbyi J07HQW2 TaxID=1238425 RepID=U1MUH8_9EURY|nr:ATP-binding protein [Haloquadratum walsbyi]ERG93989.1 MAG: hypothetical protein J07HQW2_00423 [Haloquadratum walsbyi J07HQW2]